jgi:predicted enzyme related to lactoylglutathione lyase
MKSLCVWFEIPVNDFARAKKFYSDIFQIQMEEQEMGGALMGFFPMEGYANSGAIVKGEGYEPSDKGAMIYLNGGEDLQVVQDSIELAGGKVIMKKMKVSDEIGYMAIFLDTEGNKLALHSQK